MMAGENHQDSPEQAEVITERSPTMAERDGPTESPPEESGRQEFKAAEPVEGSAQPTSTTINVKMEFKEDDPDRVFSQGKPDPERQFQALVEYRALGRKEGETAGIAQGVAQERVRVLAILGAQVQKAGERVTHWQGFVQDLRLRLQDARDRLGEAEEDYAKLREIKKLLEGP